MEEKNGTSEQQEVKISHEDLDRLGLLVEEEIANTTDEDLSHPNVLSDVSSVNSETPSSESVPFPEDDGTKVPEEPKPLTEEEKKLQRQNILRALMAMNVNGPRPRQVLSDAERAKRKKASKVAKASRKQNRKNRK